MLSLSTAFRRPPAPVSTRFVTVNIGNGLFLKAVGFMEDHRAKIVDVSETSLILEMGDSWLNRNMGNSESMPVLQIHLNFSDVTAEENAGRLPHASSSLVDVTILPMSRSWTHEQFEAATRRLLWLLRSHFMALA